MTDMTVDLLQALFLVYCAYALYASVVVFYRPDDRGAIFKQFRLPVLMAMYFGTPCVALYLLYRAFWLTYPTVFWIGVVVVGALSFFIILYFVTSPDWPVGRVLAVDRFGAGTIRALLIMSFSVSVIAAVGSSLTLGLLKPAISESANAAAYQETLQELEAIEEARRKGTDARTRLQREAILEIWTGAFAMMTQLFTAVGAVAGCAGAFLTLRSGRGDG